MIEQIEALEGKLGELIDRARSMREELLRLRNENHEMRQDLEAKEGVVKEVGTLQRELDTMREQVTEYEGKETVVKNKLQTIVDRFEDVEAEFAQLDPGDDD